MVNCLGMAPDLPQDEEMPDLGSYGTPSYGRVPEISMDTNQFKDTRDNLLEGTIGGFDRHGQEMTDFRQEILETLLSFVTKGKSRKIREPSPSSDGEGHNLVTQFAKFVTTHNRKTKLRRPSRVSR